MDMESKKMLQMARLCSILMIAMLLLTSMVFITDAEAAAAKSDAKEHGGLPKGSTKPESGCHRPGFPTPPGTSCPPSKAAAAKSNAEAAGANSHAKELAKENGFQSVNGGLPKGSTKPESGCHRPGFPTPPGTSCPPSKAAGAKSSAEAAGANSHAKELVKEMNGGLPKGSTKPESGCHRPGFPTPPGTSCPPSKAASAKSSAEAAGANSHAKELVKEMHGGFPKGSTKPESGCHRPGFPTPPGTSCPPSKAAGAKSSTEAAGANSHAKEVVKEMHGGLPKGSRKPESGCHRPGFPTPPGTSCPPSKAAAAKSNAEAAGGLSNTTPL